MVGSRLNEMKKLQDCMSPLSWMICSICVVPNLYFILHARFWDFVVFSFVDWVSFFIITKIEANIFQKLYPDVKLYFMGINEEQIKALSLEERKNLLESFIKFPARRAVFTVIGSFVKVIPAILVIVFYWEHSISNWAQFFLVCGISLINFSYFGGAIFIESHIFLSRLIKELHQKFDFSEAFSQLTLSYSKKELKIQDNLALFSVIGFILILQWVIIQTYPSASQTELALKILAIGLAGSILFGRLWFLNQSLFVGGLENLFQSMGSVDYRQNWSDLSFHTSPLLAQFEKTFNLLSRRVRRSEQELSFLISQESEKSRFRAIGEMSALIAHDLASPLHFIQFGIDQIISDPSPEKLNKYLARLSANTTRAVQLLESMKARLKNSSQSTNGTSFTKTHAQVLSLIATQFMDLEFKKLIFQIDPKLDTIRIHMSQVDLIHVLDNLYRNSVRNLLENKIQDPKVSVDVAELNDVSVEIRLSDNGTGLSSEKFEALTAYRYTQSDSSLIHQGLGLRLTRRLVEFRGGQLNVIPKPNSPGTTYQMRLPLDLNPLQNT